MRDAFLRSSRVVQAAIADERIAAAWASPSALEGQTVGGLVGHLARAVTVVEGYLDGDEPDLYRPGLESAGHYYASLMEAMTDADHAGVRQRGAEAGEAGATALADGVEAAVDRLTTRLPTEPADRRVAVIGGTVMRLDDYLVTRMVEQVVHLDDVARSVGVEPWTVPTDVLDLVLACGAEVGRRRSGGPAMIRSLFREGSPGALPVI